MLWVLQSHLMGYVDTQVIDLKSPRFLPYDDVYIVLVLGIVGQVL